MNGRTALTAVRLPVMTCSTKTDNFMKKTIITIAFALAVFSGSAAVSPDYAKSLIDKGYTLTEATMEYPDGEVYEIWLAPSGNAFIILEDERGCKIFHYLRSDIARLLARKQAGK